MPKRTASIEALREHLVRELGVPVDITVTTNRRTMISYRWDNGRLALRLHVMFLDGGRRIWRTVASFCKRPAKSNRATLDKFIRANQEIVDEPEAYHTRVMHFDTEGEHHDLLAVFTRVNEKHFKRQCDAKITWGRQAPRRRNRRGIQLGSYDPQTNIIRVHRTLDAPWVPQYVIEHLVYHEMLHWLFRPRDGGNRRIIHSKAFKDAEAAHPGFERCQTWLHKNLNRLLRF
ncbi:MAG: hypothetical protein P9L99_09740 [Candidatus Lernaella stagnicola]|nr:hypothetical protein [Candidatus Lernaella stagnicola]